MPLNNCEINLILNWSEKCVISEGCRIKIFAITDKKLYVCVVTLSILDSTKLLQQLKLGFKGVINRNKYKQ